LGTIFFIIIITTIIANSGSKITRILDAVVDRVAAVEEVDCCVKTVGGNGASSVGRDFSLTRG